jgi:Ca2+-binding EF-hand superfamily protein
VFVRASSLDLETFFRRCDAEDKGTISNLEFRNILRQIGLGLTSNEIDAVMNNCDAR